MQTATRSLVFTADEGVRTLTGMGGAIIFKATGAETDGAFALVEMRVPAGYPGLGLHIHRHTDEAFFVLEGAITFTLEDRTFEATPGAYILVPRGTPHKFSVPATGPARFLTHFTPAGFEAYFIDLFAALRASGGPPTAAMMQQLEAIHDTVTVTP